MATKEIVLTVGATGQTRGLHFDEFDLGFLGPKLIERATEIRFSGEKQWFWIELPEGTCDVHRMILEEPESDAHKLNDRWREAFCEFKSYDAARAFEVMLMHSLFLHGYPDAKLLHGEVLSIAWRARMRYNIGDRAAIGP